MKKRKGGGKGGLRFTHTHKTVVVRVALPLLCAVCAWHFTLHVHVTHVMSPYGHVAMTVMPSCGGGVFYVWDHQRVLLKNTSRGVAGVERLSSRDLDARCQFCGVARCERRPAARHRDIVIRREANTPPQHPPFSEVKSGWRQRTKAGACLMHGQRQLLHSPLCCARRRSSQPSLSSCRCHRLGFAMRPLLREDRGFRPSS